MWEWCQDWYGKKYYKKSPLSKPAGPPTGKHRVIRGGSWNLGAFVMRAAYRIGNTPENTSNQIGFRCAKDS